LRRESYDKNDNKTKKQKADDNVQFAFFNKLCNMTERIKVFNHMFNSKSPQHIERFKKKKEMEEVKA